LNLHLAELSPLAMAIIFFLNATESSTGLGSGFTTLVSVFFSIVLEDGSVWAFPQPEIRMKRLKLNNI
jgi:hypothetical protein